MKRAANLRDLELPVLLPGIKINTSPTNFHPIRQMQLARWDGKHFERFGKVRGGRDGVDRRESAAGGDIERRPAWLTSYT